MLSIRIYRQQESRFFGVEFVVFGIVAALFEKLRDVVSRKVARLHDEACRRRRGVGCKSTVCHRHKRFGHENGIQTARETDDAAFVMRLLSVSVQ